MAIKDFEASVVEMLAKVFPDSQLVRDWDPFPGGEYDAPKPDIAVGPLAVEGRYDEIYSKLLGDTWAFFKALVDEHNFNVRNHTKGSRPSGGHVEEATYEGLITSNTDARCFLYIDIENESTKKHVLGTLVNASALAKVAVIIGWDADKLGTIFELRRYLRFLHEANSNTPYAQNVLILSPGQFESALNEVLTPAAGSEQEAEAVVDLHL